MSRNKNRYNIFEDSCKKSHTKYSNVELFGRREKEFLNNKKHTKYFSTTNHRKVKQKILEKENVLYPLLKTLSSFGTINKDFLSEKPNLQFMSTTTTINKNKTDRRFESIFKIDAQSKNNNNIFLTERNSHMGLHKKRKKKISLNNFKNNLEFKPKIDDKNPLSNLICHTEKEQYCKTSREKNDYLLDYKMQRLHDDKEKESAKYYIKKFHEFKILNFTVNEKKERVIRIKEANESDLQYYEDTISSLKNYKQIFISKFCNKTADYLRFILKCKDFEKIKCLKLIQNVINLKSDIEQINNKMKKVELEKSNIIRWIYLQIKLKEKRLILPPSYKAIIEPKNFDNSVKDRRHDSQKKKKLTRRFTADYFKNNDVETAVNKNSNNNNVLKFSKSGVVNVKNAEETQRIKNYKNELIFKTPESFQDALMNIENQILTFIEQKDHIQAQLLELKKYLIKVTNQEKEFKDDMDKKINDKQKEVDQLKIIYNNKIKLLNKIKQKPKKKLVNKKRKKNITPNKDKTSIINKIYKIYDKCKSIDINEPNNLLNIINNYDIEFQKEDNIVKILKFIELSVDNLIKKVKGNVENKNNFEIQELIKKVTSEIERRHKIDIAKKQKMQEIEKNNKLRNEIEERNNIIHLLQGRKIDYCRFKIKKEKKTIESVVNNEPQFGDFISEAGEEIEKTKKIKENKKLNNNKDNSEDAEKSEEISHIHTKIHY